MTYRTKINKPADKMRKQAQHITQTFKHKNIKRQIIKKLFLVIIQVGARECSNGRGYGFWTNIFFSDTSNINMKI